MKTEEMLKKLKALSVEKQVMVALVCAVCEAVDAGAESKTISKFIDRLGGD